VNMQIVATRSAQVKIKFHEMLDAALVEAKTEAAAQVRQELHDDLRRKLPAIARRLKRKSKNPFLDSAKGALLSTLGGNPRLAAGLILPQIASEHLWTHVIDPQIETIVSASTVLFVSKVVDEILESCVVAITAYPHDCQPRLPRRCDVARAVHRRCRRPCGNGR
jgi:hypothetical protein